MELITDRLELKPMTAGDWPFFLELQQQTELMRYISDPLSEAEIREKFELRLPPWTEGQLRHFVFVVTTLDTRQPIGLFGGFAMAGALEAEVGYMLTADAQGQGYAKEALAVLIEHTFIALGYQAISARVAEGNQASAGLLSRLGFEFVEKKHTDLILKGAPVADLLFRLQRENWQVS